MKCHDFERERQQGVSRQDRHRFAKHLVIGGTATSKVVVVHGGQIVMNQRVGMHHLNRTGCGKRGFDVAATRFGRQQNEQRSQPLATREQAVGHRFPQFRWTICSGGGCGRRDILRQP